MSSFHSYIRFPIQVLGIAVSGWIFILRKMFGRMLHFFQQKTGFERIFFLSLLVQMLSSGMGWIQYSIRFQGVEESVAVSVSWNVYFMLGSGYNLFFAGFWKSRWVWPSFFAVQSFLLLLLGLGSFDPGRFFVAIQNPNDYRFHPIYYVFCSASILNFFLGLFLFQQERRKFKSPILKTRD